MTDKRRENIEKVVEIGKAKRIPFEGIETLTRLCCCTGNFDADLDYVISELEKGTETPTIISELLRRVPKENVLYSADE